jgi:hypothetical protein
MMKKKTLNGARPFFNRQREKKARNCCQVPFLFMMSKTNNWWPLGAILVDNEKKRDLMAIRYLHSSKRGEKALGGY